MLALDAIDLYCKTNCDRYYKKRVIVARTLHDLDNCATADEIWTQLYYRKSRVSFGAIYKILNWLIENGFAEKRQRSGAYVAMKRRLTSIISSSLEERYSSFINFYPDIVQRVPQHMIASFMGLQPETLSQIRRRISSK